MKKQYIKISILGLVVAFLMLSSYISIAYENNIQTEVEVEEVDQKENIVSPPVDSQEDAVVVDETPESVTGLVVGFDVSGGLTDVLMVGHLDTETNEVKVISVPRDLIIDFTDEKFKHIKENNPNNHIYYCKLNEVYSLSGWDDRALQDVREIISIITGLKIDYIASLDVYGFTEIVDIIGGVEFDVPERMYKEDPVQDLLIDLYPGVQFLDGDKAEQLVRYRGYTLPDIERIQVQQDFMVALANKVLNIRDFSQITQIATATYNKLKTDFGLVVVMEYADYIFNADLGGLINSDNMITIPSYGIKIDKIWYQDWKEEEALEVVDDLINNGKKVNNGELGDK